jgi:hypothetical protein
LGHLMAQYLPDRTICGISLNPGPFNVKVSPPRMMVSNGNAE